MIEAAPLAPRVRRRLPAALPLSPFATRLAVLGLLALGLRLLYILVIAPPPVGLDGDWHFYQSSADQIAQGHFFYRGIFHRYFVTAEHPPLYPLVLGALTWLGGLDLQGQRVVGAVIGAISVVMFGIVARRLAGERAGTAAALIAAIYPPLIVVDGALMSEPLLVLGILVSLLLSYRLVEAPSVGLAVVLGAVLGLTTLAHTEALMLLALMVVPAAWRGRHGRWARIGGAVAACAIVLAPWVIRNEVVFARFTLGTDTNTVIAGANCRQTYYGRNIGWWSLACDAKGRTFRQLVEGDANTHPALHYIRQHLARAALVATVRVLRSFSMFQPLREGNGQIRRRWLDIIGLIIYYPLLIAAVIGYRRLRRWRWPLLAPILVAIIVSAGDSGLPRLRIPADIGLILLGAVAVGAIARRAGTRAATSV